MSSVQVEIIGARDVMAHFSELPGLTRKALNRQVTSFVIQLQRYVKEHKLSGDPLKVQTGTLRRSITYQVADLGDAIEGTVGTNVRYGAVHEFGYHGTVMVKDYIRKQLSRNKAKFVPVKFNKNSTRVKLQQTESGVAFVHAHSRRVDLPERSFLRSSLRELAGDFQRQMKEAVDSATKQKGGGK